MKIGFIGLGNMGSAMARNLTKAGHTLTVYNRTRSRADCLAKEGAAVAETPGHAAAKAEIVITMLADDHALEEVMFSPDGIAGGLPAGGLHVGMSTISVALSRRLAEAHRERKQHYISAPVFGRPEAAAAAKLFVVAAGDQEQIERASALFSVLGQKMFITGKDPELANVVKLTGNFLITTVLEGLAESFALARKSGVEPAKLLEILTGSPFGAPIYQTYGSMIAAGKFEPVGFKLPLGLKDNRLLLEAAEEAAVPMPMASLVRDRFIAAIAQGLGDADWSAIALLAMRSAGIEQKA
jgi:3-hydroxyisobutyrate dehydrogenase-like beta-hydroxyacid dehydrogenase